MAFLFVWSCFLLLLVYVTDSIIIDTKLGKIKGINDEFGSFVFLNIPYATPPTIDNGLRWRATQPLEDDYKFDGVYNGTVAGNACVQPSFSAAMMINGSNGIMSEDCLTLGIQTSFKFYESKDQPLRKVLFWIHGGGLASGTGYGYVFGNLAINQEIVIVSINYRLGVAAWLTDPELYDNDNGNGGANGFLDMIEALKWVKRNIESYGGDPNDITIAGESGGGWAVCGLLLSPLAKGLFTRSIQMSGSCIQSLGKFFSEQEGWEIAKLVRNSNNVTKFDELRTIDMNIIIDTFSLSMKSILPAIDGFVFPLSTLDLLKSGYANGESTMIGTVFRESFSEKPFNMAKSPQNLNELNDYYSDKLFDIQATLMQKYYPQNEVFTKIWPYGKSYFNESIIINTVAQTDCWVKCGSIWQADMLSTNPLTKDSFNVYFYQYGYIEEPYDQVSHGYDIIGLFGMDIDWINGGVVFSQKFMEQTQTFFGNYIKGGIVPIKDGKVVSVQNGYYIQIVEDIKIVNIDDLNHIRDRCEIYKIFGDEIWRDPFCTGMYFDEVMEQFGNNTDTVNATESACEETKI